MVVGGCWDPVDSEIDPGIVEADDGMDEEGMEDVEAGENVEVVFVL